jgi:transglutaminase-like putative cysteine protease
MARKGVDKVAKSIYEYVASRCPNCGAAVPPANATICAFCGSHLILLPDARDALPNKRVSYNIWHDVREIIEGPLPNKLRFQMSIAQAQNQIPYQIVKKVEVYPSIYRNISDDEGNIYAFFDQIYTSIPHEVSFQIRYEVEIREMYWPLEDGDGPMIQGYTNPERYLESNAPQIVELSAKITRGKPSPLKKALAIYNFVGDNFRFKSYDPSDRGALFALSKMEGDCTEFADLYVALCRAAGIPTRYVDGVSTNPDPVTPKHSWAENYFPGMGWVTVDPTWGRTPENRDRYFAFHPRTHIIFSRGRNLSSLKGYHYWYNNWTYWGNEPKINKDEKWTLTSRIDV